MFDISHLASQPGVLGAQKSSFSIMIAHDQSKGDAMTNRISRRAFLSTGAATSAVLAINTSTASQPPPSPIGPNPAAGNWVRWLDGSAPAVAQGVTWGTPWPRGQVKSVKNFSLRASGTDVPLQSWPLAFWPDGSLKWTAHALAPGQVTSDGPFEVVAQRASSKAPKPLTVNESAESIEVDTGALKRRVNRQGTNILTALTSGGREALREGRLVLLRQDRAAGSDAAVVHQESFESAIEKVTLEQRGPARAVIKVEGKHAGAGRAWLPFTLRLYFYAGSDELRVLHTIVFDGDESRDFIRGVGVRFSTPLGAELHDRHVRFVGDADGLFAEAIRGLT